MSRLRIDVFSPPFHGHLHPILGLARELRGYGDVRVFSAPSAAPSVHAAELELHPILAGQDAAIHAIPNTSGPVRGRPWMLWSQFQKNMHLMPALQADVQAAWAKQKPDLALVDFTLPAIGHWALAHNIHWWTSHPSPLAIETPDGPPSYLGGLKPPRGPAGKLRDTLGRASTRFFKRLVFALTRKQMARLGITRPYRDDGSEQVYSDEALLALGLRELEFAKTWPSATRFIGPILYTPPVKLENANSSCELDARRKNVLVTIGTHLPYARQHMLTLVESWARAIPDVFFHYTMGGETSHTAAAANHGENWRAYPYINYETQMDRFDAIVHHGGAGITYYAMRAARPAVVLPHDYDQFDFAARLEHAHLARWCRKPVQVPQVLSEALQDETMRKEQMRYRELLRTQDTRAHLERLLREHSLV